MKVASAVFNVRIVATAEASLEAIRERNRFGMAIAAMIRMIATTMSSSIRLNPMRAPCFIRIGTNSSRKAVGSRK